MKKIIRLATIVSSLFISSALIIGLSTTASFPKQKGFGYHGKINALKLDSNKDDVLSKDELLSHNTRRFTRLDSNEDGSISEDEFNAHLIAMFEAMDSNGDGMLKGNEMPKRHQGGHRKHDYGQNHG